MDKITVSRDWLEALAKEAEAIPKLFAFYRRWGGLDDLKRLERAAQQIEEAIRLKLLGVELPV